MDYCQWKKTLTSLAKRVLVTFGSTGAASATVFAFQKQIQESEMTALIISNKEKKDIIKVVKAPDESGLLVKGISETIEIKPKKKRCIF